VSKKRKVGGLAVRKNKGKTTRFNETQWGTKKKKKGKPVVRTKSHKKDGRRTRAGAKRQKNHGKKRDKRGKLFNAHVCKKKKKIKDKSSQRERGPKTRARPQTGDSPLGETKPRPELGGDQRANGFPSCAYTNKKTQKRSGEKKQSLEGNTWVSRKNDPRAQQLDGTKGKKRFERKGHVHKRGKKEHRRRCKKQRNTKKLGV